MAVPEGRVLYRLMLAAVETTVDTDREACILGAILRSLIAADSPHRFDPAYIMRASLILHEWGRWVTDDPTRFPLTPIGPFDVAPINLRFRNCHKETRTT